MCKRAAISATAELLYSSARLTMLDRAIAKGHSVRLSAHHTREPRVNGTRRCRNSFQLYESYNRIASLF